MTATKTLYCDTELKYENVRIILNNKLKHTPPPTKKATLHADKTNSSTFSSIRLHGYQLHASQSFFESYQYAQPVKNSQLVMELEYALSCSQQPAIGPYHEP
jgi:hypothetical protein